MKKRFLSMCLALVMMLGMIVSAIPAVSAASKDALPFKDVGEGDWFREYVKFVYERDLMKGVSGTEFGPNSSMTRGQIVTILSRMSGDKIEGAKSSLTFTDVDPNKYYADPIGWAVKNEIAKGKGPGRFDPDAPVRRQEFAAFFVRYMKYKGIEFPGKKVAPFPDKDIPDWAKADVETLHSIGLVTGDAKGYFNPTKQMSRAEIATVVTRFVKTEEDLPSTDTEKPSESSSTKPDPGPGEDSSETGSNPPEPPVTDALKKAVDAWLDENLCIAHYKLDLIFNYRSSLTEENLLACVKNIMDLGDTVEVSLSDANYDVDYEISSKYQDSGDQGYTSDPSDLASNWFDDVPFRFTDTATGEVYDIEIDLAIYKVLASRDLGYPAGTRAVCPDDRDKAFHKAGEKFSAFAGNEEEPAIFEGEFTSETLEAKAREITGLSDSAKYPFFVLGFDAEKVNEGMDLTFGFIDKSGAVPADALDLIQVTTFMKGGPSVSLQETVDNWLDENLCIAHYKLDLIFNYSSSVTEENLLTLVKKVMKLPEAVEVSWSDDTFNFQSEVVSEYGLSGSQGYTSDPTDLATVWIDAVPFRFTNTATGEVYDVDIDLAMYKVLCSGEIGYPAGARAVCPDDRDVNFHKAGYNFAQLQNPPADPLDPEHDIPLVFEGDFTPEGIEAKAREITGLSDAEKYPFFIVGFDAAQYSTGCYVTFGFIDKSGAVPEDALDVIVIDTFLKAQEGAKDPMYDIIEEKLTWLLCLAHGKLDIMFGPSSTLTADNLNALLSDAFGLGDSYTVEVGDDDIAYALQSYSGAGNGDSVWVDGIVVTFTNTVTGESHEEDIDFSFIKNIFAINTGAVDSCALSLCWDDVTPEMKNAITALNDYNTNDEKVVNVPSDEVYGAEWVEAYFRQISGLTDAEKYVFYADGIEPAKATGEDGDYVCFTFKSVAEYEDIEGARTYCVGGEAVFKFTDPLQDDIDNLYDDLACIAHYKLDLVFGTSGTLDSLPEVLTGIFGYDASISDDDLSYVKDSYGGLGSGQYAWPDTIEVTFTNSATGNTYVKEIDLSLFKSVYGKYAGAIGDTGFFGVCPDDLPANVKAALDKVEPWDDKQVFEIGEEFTVEAIEAWYREQTGLTGDEWTFFIGDFDEENAVTGDEVFLALRCDDVNGEGRTEIVSCGPTLKITIPSLKQRVDDALDEYLCIAHGKLDFIFNFSPNFTEERLFALVKKTLGLADTVEVSWYDDTFSFEADILKDYSGSGSQDYGRDPSNLAANWFDAIPFRFTDTLTEEVYDIDIDLAIYKVTPAAELGYVEGVRTLCPDDRDQSFHAAGYNLAPLDGTSDNPVTFDGELTPENIEAKARELTGLTDAEKYPFFIVGYDAEKIYTGMILSFGFFDRSGYVPEDALDIVIIHDTCLKQAYVDTMQKDIDDLYDEIACIAHYKLDFVCGNRDTIDYLCAALTELFGYEASIDPDDINYIKNDFGGLGGNQTAWPDTIEVTFTNPISGSTYVKEIDFALYKALSANAAGVFADRIYFGMCPDDWTAEIKAAMKVTTEWDDDQILEVTWDEYTPEAIEAWFREVTGLSGEDWEFFMNWFDADEAAADGNEIVVALVNHNVENEGRTVAVSGEITLKLVNP